MIFRRGTLGVVGLVWILAISPILASHDKSDTAMTDDGATYIGEIKSVQYATLTLNTNPAGLLSIEWRHVKSLISKFEYRVELSGGVRHYGTLGTPKKPGQLSIVTSDGSIDVGLDDIFEIVPLEHGFLKRLDGSVNFGLSYTQANEALQYNLGGNADYRTRRNYATLSGQSIFNTQAGGTTTNQFNLQLVVIQVGKKRWGAFEIGSIASNPDQGYDLRTVVGGGATNFLIETSRKFLNLSLGAVYNREDVTDDQNADNSAEALVGVSFRRFKRGSHSPSVELSLTTFTETASDPRFRATFKFNVGWKIVGDFKFNFEVTDNYDSAPPGTDSKNNNLTVVTSVGYTF